MRKIKSIQFWDLLFVLFMFLFPHILLFPASYYLDDNSDAGDLWTPAAAGDDLNSGLTINSPKATLSNLITSYVLQAGDIIYIDTGIYKQRAVVNSSDSGNISSFITFFGAGTNRTIMNATNYFFGLKITNSSFIKFSSLCIRNAGIRNISFLSASNCVITNVAVKSSAQQGISILKSSGLILEDCALIKNKTEGIRLAQESINNIIDNCRVCLSCDGFVISNSSRNIFKKNTVYLNSYNGLKLRHSLFLYLTNNNCFNNSRDGIAVSGCSYSVFYNNRSWQNSYDGLTLFTNQKKACDHNYICRNRLVKNKGTESDGLYFNGKNNTVLSNLIATNYGHGIIQNNCSNFIACNWISSNGANGIWFDTASSMIIISNNKIFRNRVDGIGGGAVNRIRTVYNEVSYNNACGITFYWLGAPVWRGSHNQEIKYNIVHNNKNDGIFNDGNVNFIISNIAYSNRFGIFMKGDIFTNMFNCSYGNQQDGILAENIRNSLIRNCTLYKNKGSGICISTLQNVYMRNCIAVSNNIGYQDFNYLDYSLAWGNSLMDYSSIPDTGCLTNDPGFESVDPLSSDFLSLSGLRPSAAINSGSPSDPVPVNGGTRIDMGCYEYKIVNTEIKIVKNIKRISLNNNPVLSGIPGSTVRYQICYTNKTDMGEQCLIYDRVIDHNTVFLSNSCSNSGPGWIAEFSTNIAPEQSWGSIYYSAEEPSPLQLKWVRWKKTLVGKSHRGGLYFSVIIK